MSNKLFSNSLYLIISALLNSSVGFIFLIIITRLFSADQVGYASNIISSYSVIATIAIFGLDEAIIKYYAKSNKKQEIIGISLILSIVIGFITALIFAAILAGSVGYIRAAFSNILIFALFILSSIIWVIFMLVEPIYVAMRESKYVLLKNFIFNALKLIGPFVLIVFGFFGIYLSWSIPALIGLLLTILIRRIKFVPKFNFKLFYQLLKFSFVNYISNILFWSKGFILPLVITSLIGASHTAFFYIPFNFLHILYVIPKSLARALFAELSHDTNGFKEKIIKSFLLSFVSGIFFIIVIFAAGKFILSFFGVEYMENSLQLLKLFSIAGIFVGFNEVFLTLVKHKLEMFDIFLIRGFPSILTVVLSLFLIRHGISGVGYALLISEALISVIVVIRNIQKNGKLI